MGYVHFILRVECYNLLCLIIKEKNNGIYPIICIKLAESVFLYELYTENEVYNLYYF